MEIQLPDYLPARYQNWLALYLHVIKQFTAQGISINESTKVKLYEMGDHKEQKELREQYGEEVVHFYQEFPLILIKARAFDFILPNLPSQEEVYRFRFDLHNASMYSSNANAVEKNENIIGKLMSICPKDRQLSK